VTPTLVYPLDGRPFLSDTGLTSAARDEIFIEYFKDANRESIPSWASIRSDAFQYVQYHGETGAVVFREYYDLVADPYQLVNLLGDGNAANDPDTSALAVRLARYRSCAGTTGTTVCA